MLPRNKRFFADDMFKDSRFLPLLLLLLLLHAISSFQLAAAPSPNQHDEKLASEAESLSESKRPIVDLKQLQILELDQSGFNWRRDWWKYMLIVVGSLLTLTMLLHLTSVLLRLLGVVICLVVGSTAAILTEPWLSPQLINYLPASWTNLIPIKFFAMASGFLLAYSAAALLLALLKKPFRKRKKRHD